ncbi:MAG: CCA tRNA nucleotidyltransferase [Candidatus Thorarchaeota archaeon]
MLVKDNIPIEIINICRFLTNHGFQAYIVGGSIRDIILGTFTPQDWDIATDAKPSEVMDLFTESFRVLPTGIKHGTVTILYNEKTIEVTTFRIEGDYVDGRRPSNVHFVKSIIDDLSRRDLTINAIAYDPINNILSDPFNGIKDIKSQIIRMVGEPHERLQEDGLRLIRIFRFVSQLGFNVETKTSQAVPLHFEVFKKVAKERVHSEFQKLLRGEFFQKALVLLEDSGLLYQIIPELCSKEFQQEILGLNQTRIELTMNIISKLPNDSSARLRFAALIHQLPIIEKMTKKPFPPFQERSILESMKRIKCSNKQIADVSHILSIHLHPLPYTLTKSSEEKNYLVRKFQYDIRPEYLYDYLMFYDAKEKALQKKKRLTADLKADIIERAKHNPPIELNMLSLNGEDVIQYLQLEKKIASQRELIGLCLQILRERVEVNPLINHKHTLFTILDNINRILNQCTTRITRTVRVVSTDHIRKLYRNNSPEYTPWENSHTYLLAKWLILCLLRKDSTTIVIFDGTNFNMPTHPNYRRILGYMFRQYRPLYINTSATNSEVILNLNARGQEESSIKKSEADFKVFQRYQELLQSYPNALNTPKEYRLIELSTRHLDYKTKIQETVKLINQSNNRLIIMSGNVLTGKTYTAYFLQRLLESSKAQKI